MYQKTVPDLYHEAPKAGNSYREAYLNGLDALVQRKQRSETAVDYGGMQIPCLTLRPQKRNTSVLRGITQTSRIAFISRFSKEIMNSASVTMGFGGCATI